jgi:hypothetical protein
LIHVHLVGHGELPQVRHALHRNRRLPRLAQDREQDTDQNGDDPDHDQQLH